MTGIWGTRVANDLARRADVILAVGTAFGEADCSSWNPNYTFAIPPTQLIQIDIDPQEVGKIYPVAVGLVGDAKATLLELAARIQAAAPRRSAARAADVKTQKEAWQTELAVEQRNAEKPIHPARLLNEISRVAPKDTVFVTDVGWNKNGAGQQLVTTMPQSFITSGGLATMGFSPAAAIGAKIAAPNRPVMALVGDGGFLSVAGALTTAVELGIPVVWVDLQQLLFLDDPHRRHDLLQQRLRHGVPHARRRAVQPGFRAAGESVRDRSGAGGGARRSAGGADEGAGRQRAVPARSPHARRRADAAHRPLGYRRIPAQRKRLTRATGHRPARSIQSHGTHPTGWNRGPARDVTILSSCIDNKTSSLHSVGRCRRELTANRLVERPVMVRRSVVWMTMALVLFARIGQWTDRRDRPDLRSRQRRIRRRPARRRSDRRPRPPPARPASSSPTSAASTCWPICPSVPTSSTRSCRASALYQRTGITLTVGANPVINVMLKIGTVQETVTVTANCRDGRDPQHRRRHDHDRRADGRAAARTAGRPRSSSCCPDRRSTTARRAR